MNNVVLMSKFYSVLKLALHVSDLIGFVQAVFADFGMCRVVRVLPRTKVCKYSFYKTLLVMDR